MHINFANSCERLIENLSILQGVGVLADKKDKSKLLSSTTIKTAQEILMDIPAEHQPAVGLIEHDTAIYMKFMNSYRIRPYLSEVNNGMEFIITNEPIFHAEMRKKDINYPIKTDFFYAEAMLYFIPYTVKELISLFMTHKYDAIASMFKKAGGEVK